jgi:hypothetical protein
MKLAFQDTSIELNEVNDNFDAVIALGETPLSFGLIPFSTEIRDCNFTEPTIMFGSTKLVKLSLQGYLPEHGIVFYDAEKFDQAYYNNILGDILLNHKAEFVKWGDIKNQEIYKPMFIKPSSDLKYFAGQLLQPGCRTVEGELSQYNYIDIDITDDTNILINFNTIPELIREYRVFVIDHVVADISQYMKDGKVTPDIVDYSTYARILDFVMFLESIYSPHEHYVVDITEDVDEKLWVVEYNCINCSGMYKINRKLVFEELLAL